MYYNCLYAVHIKLEIRISLIQSFIPEFKIIKYSIIENSLYYLLPRRDHSVCPHKKDKPFSQENS